MTMLALKPRVFTVVRALFKIGLLCCFTLGALLVLGQLAGVLAQRPEWVTGASDLLFVPTIGAAAAFGVLGFVAGYLEPRESEED
ncbi:hypothetical protein [Nocardiopsis sp. MG754419]|uniref:hypothetical protein n=1 Tax=Nocardiopsis sp. MG754419 TaxID=2259865 RepID=UPI001BADC207|nr:hypothetical protein [Nocardiopsis sp. MG754419]MBR8742105.1 hypothetical protein [Nocardiopsis sp. MG754419]